MFTWSKAPFPFIDPEWQSYRPPPSEGHQHPPSLLALRRLLKPDELAVAFQPIVSLSDGGLFAYEALARCHVAELRSPLVLFERAVEERCVGRLGRAIRDLARPLATGHRLFVNVHPLELNEEWLVRPDDPIYGHDHDVFLEITESVPLSGPVYMEILKEVGSKPGVHLVVDDLGAGYSNLCRIADLQPAVVKVDRQLVAGVHESARRQQLLSSVVRLCADLGARVVAEGIETQSELLAVIDSGAEFGQGYLFAKPAFPLPEVYWPVDEGRSGSRLKAHAVQGVGTARQRQPKG